MKFVLYILIALCPLFACNHSLKETRERIINSDSVVVNYFKGDGSMDTVVGVRFIRDVQKIEQLATLISKRSLNENYKCGYDGSMHFFKMNKVIQDIDFRMNENDCMHFSFLQHGQPRTSTLSPEAKELINSFRK